MGCGGIAPGCGGGGEVVAVLLGVVVVGVGVYVVVVDEVAAPVGTGMVTALAGWAVA